MELKNDSIREVIQKEGIGSAKDKFGTESVTNELKKDIELVKGIFSTQSISSFDYIIYQLLPLEVSRLFQRDIINFQIERVMQKNPTANREEVKKSIEERFKASIIRKEYSEKSELYNDLYWGVDFAIQKYGNNKVEDVLKTNSKLKQNLIYWGRIEEIVEEKKEPETTIVEQPKVEESKAEEPKAEEPKAEEPKAEEPKAEEPKAEEPKAEEPKAEEPKAEEPKQDREESNNGAIDIEKLSKKGQALVKKINELCEKCENENNLAKKHLLKFRLRMLSTRLQYELDLANLQEEYKIKAKELESKQDKTQQGDIEYIIKVNQLKKQRANYIRSNSEYDYASSDFMFPKSTVESLGGIDQFAKLLQEDKNPIIQDAGKRIAAIVKYRQEIDTLNKKQNERKNIIEEREVENNQQRRELDFEKTDKMIELKEKNSLLLNIPKIFQMIKDSVREYRAEKAEKREIEAKYKQKEEELKQQYDLYMRKIREASEKANNPITKRRDSEFFKSVRVKTTEEPTNADKKPENAFQTKPRTAPTEHSGH